MEKPIKKGMIIIFLLLTSHSIFAQSNDDFVNNMINAIDQYYIGRPHDNIYVHTDRSVYFSNDVIMMRLVANEAANLAPAERSNKCVVTLVDARGEQVISNTYDLNKGYASASFKIPGNLNQGRYNLLAYTMKDNMITANKVFNKDIIITDPSGQLMMDYQFDKEFYVPSQKINLKLSAYGFKSKPVAKLDIDYKLKFKEKILDEGTGKTDKEGNYTISYQLPESLPENLIIELDAKKRKIEQQMFIKVPFAIPVEEKAITGLKKGIRIEVKDLTDNKLRIGLKYSDSQFKAEKRIVIALFRKGLLYWSAPGQLSQASDISIPITRVPSGIIDIVVFDPEGYVLAEKMAYNERENMPFIELKLNKDVYNQRQEVQVEVSFKGNIINIPNETYLSASVVPKEMVPMEDLLLDDHMLIDVDLQQDTREMLVRERNSNDRKTVIENVLREADRNGYSWEQVLNQEETGKNIVDETEIKEDVNVLYFPSYFNAARMKDYSKGISDKRHPNAQQQNYKRQLESGMSVLEVVKTIKPYTMYGNKIIFPGKLNSLNAQQGALIVVDNQMLGQDATVLNSISPTEVEEINVSTNPSDVQRYTALNSVGVVEVTMKGYNPGSRISDKTDRDELIRDSYGKYLPGYPDYSLESDARSVVTDYRKLLFWQADLQADENKEVGFSFYTSDMPGTYVITVQGMIGAQPLAVRKEFEVR